MDFDQVISWFMASQGISKLQSVFQLGVGINLVALGYAERRLALQDKIENEINYNIDALSTLNQRFDQIIDVTDAEKRRENKSEIDSTIQKKWDVIQIEVISTKVNNNFYRLYHKYQKSDKIYRITMFSIALLCCFGLFMSSFEPAEISLGESHFSLQNWVSVIFCLVSVVPSIIRFYHASRQASAYRQFMVGDRPKPSSDKLDARHARVNRSIEEEKEKFAKRLNRSSKGFATDQRFTSVLDNDNTTALYFITGQIKSRVKRLPHKL